jgi:hypothetical protein
VVKSKFVAALAGVLVCGLSAQAEPGPENVEFDRPGGYVGMGASYGFELSMERELARGLGTPVSVDNSWGFHLYTGYRVSSMIAFETEIEYLNNFDVSSGGTEIGKIDMLAVTANLKFPLLPGRIQPYPLVGFGLFHSSRRHNPRTGEVAGAYRVGAGVDVYATPHLVVTGDVVYLSPFGNHDLDGFDYLRVGFGLAYRY